MLITLVMHVYSLTDLGNGRKRNKPRTVWLFILDKCKRGSAGSHVKGGKNDNYICALVSGKCLDVPAGE